MKDVMWGTMLINSVGNSHQIVNIYGNIEPSNKCLTVNAK